MNQEWETIIEHPNRPEINISIKDLDEKNCLMKISKNALDIVEPFKMGLKKILKVQNVSNQYIKKEKLWKIPTKYYKEIRELIIDSFHETFISETDNILKNLPECLQSMFKGGLTTKDRQDAIINIATFEMYTNNKRWEEIVPIIKAVKPITKTQGKTLILTEKTIEELSIEEQKHSCKTILGNDFFKKHCIYPKKYCEYLTEDITIKKSHYEIMDLIIAHCELHQLPTFILKKTKEYLIPLSEKYFTKEGEIRLTLEEFNTPKKFELEFLAVQKIRFRIPGVKKEEKKENWDKILEALFSNVKTPFGNENIGTKEELENHFTNYIDKEFTNESVITLIDELEAVKRYGLEGVANFARKIFIPSHEEKENKLYITKEVMENYIERNNIEKYTDTTDMRVILGKIIKESNKKVKIGEHELILWELYFIPVKYPNIEKLYTKWRKEESKIREERKDMTIVE